MLSPQLHLAELGYAVFPCKPGGKAPLTEHGLNDATTDEGQIEAWSAKWPASNWAVRTDGLLVVDVDGADNQWFSELGDKALELAIGPVSMTPKGGRHFIFRQPDGGKYGNTQGTLGHKVDTRANGGYIVVAPSVVDGKPYRWVDGAPEVGPDKLPLPPQWILNALAKKPLRVSEQITSGKIKEGGRNVALFRLGSCLRRPGLDEAEIFAALQTANANRCDPPLPDDEVRAIAKSVAKYQPDRDTAAAIVEHDGNKRPILVTLSSVERQPVRWLWRPRFALGKLSILAGEPGLGKSFLTMYLAACVTKGQPWTDTLDEENKVGSVVLLSAEDDLEDTIGPRLDAAGADGDLITALAAIDLGNGHERTFNLDKDLPELEQAIVSKPNCRLVIVDPVTAYCGKTDTHKGSDVRGLLTPLTRLAHKHGVAVVAVSHLSKGKKGDARKAMHLVTGSHAFIAQARAGWLVQEDAQDNKRRLLLPLKNNLAENVGGLAFRIVNGIVEWEKDPVMLTADEAVNEGGSREPSQVDAAADWLSDYLAKGSKPRAEIDEAAEAEMITQATLRRAKDRLGVISRKEGFQGNSRWVWEIPGQPIWGPTGEDAQLSPVSLS